MGVRSEKREKTRGTWGECEAVCLRWGDVRFSGSMLFVQKANNIGWSSFSFPLAALVFGFLVLTWVITIRSVVHYGGPSPPCAEGTWLRPL